MSDDSQQPIIVKRIKKGGGAAHGGAWKIAYADFVTAMMAFFLLMWLLGSTSQGDLKGIADYFNTPLKVALEGGSGSGDTSTTLLQGGGEDLTRSNGQVRKGEMMTAKDSVKIAPLQNEIALAKEKVETQKLTELKQLIESKIDNNPSLRQFKNQLLLDITAEGLRIQIVDEKNRPMFDSASADLKPYTRIILREIGNALNGVVNRISLSGHTDATQFAGGSLGIGNWELSASRAHASRSGAILELGCGTGTHAAHFAAMGYNVTGIDQSESMLEQARARQMKLSAEVAARLTFARGDVRSFRGGGSFDVVLSLFHVFSYQTTNQDLQAAFATAASHLAPGGLLIFDYWYGPAVLTQRPEVRVKRLEDESLRVMRIAEPEMKPSGNCVTVNYWVLMDSKTDARSERLSERHDMRYLFIPEIEAMASPWFLPKAHFAWQSRREPDSADWAAVSVMERKA